MLPCILCASSICKSIIDFPCSFLNKLLWRCFFFEYYRGMLFIVITSFRDLEGVPRININIDGGGGKSWQVKGTTDSPVHYYEEHTISTPPHHSTKSPIATLDTKPPHSIVVMEAGDDVVDGDDALVNGEVLPDRVVKTVTTITDHASIYSKRKQVGSLWILLVTIFFIENPYIKTHRYCELIWMTVLLCPFYLDYLSCSFIFLKAL